MRPENKSVALWLQQGSPRPPARLSFVFGGEAFALTSSTKQRRWDLFMDICICVKGEPYKYNSTHAHQLEVWRWNQLAEVRNPSRLAERYLAQFLGRSSEVQLPARPQQVPGDEGCGQTPGGATSFIFCPLV